MTKAICFLAALGAAAGLAQESTRQIWNEEFQQKRPAGPTQKKPANLSYRPVGPSQGVVNAAAVGDATMVGVTLWKIRPATPADPKGARLMVLVRPGAKGEEEVPERVDPRAELASGGQYRLSVEVPSRGYLYVIDREKFKDGTLGPPYLIYPNWQTRPSDNVVAPGRLIEIPDRREEVNVFTLQPKPNQVAEVLSLVVSPEPFSGLKIGHDPLELNGALYADWEKKWGVEAQQFDLEGSQGKGWTAKEDQAGADRGTALTQEDPLPQTLYRLNVKPGSPVLLQVPLKIKQ